MALAGLAVMGAMAAPLEKAGAAAMAAPGASRAPREMPSAVPSMCQEGRSRSTVFRMSRPFW